MCGFSELGRSLVKEFQVSTREHNIESNDFRDRSFITSQGGGGAFQ